MPGYRVLASTGRFTTGDSDWHAREGLVLTVTVVRTEAAEGPRTPADAGVGGGVARAEGAGGGDAGEEALQAAIRERVMASMGGVRPFVDLSILSD